MKKTVFICILLFNSLGFAQSAPMLYAEDLLKPNAFKKFYTFAKQTGSSVEIYSSNPGKILAGCGLGDNSLLQIIDVKKSDSAQFVIWQTILLQFPQNVLNLLYPNGKFRSLKKSAKDLGEIYYYLHENEFGNSWNIMLANMQERLETDPTLQTEFDRLVAFNDRYADMGHYEISQTITISRGSSKDSLDTSKFKAVDDLHFFFEGFPEKIDEAQKIFNQIFQEAALTHIPTYWVTFKLVANSGDSEAKKCAEKATYKFSLSNDISKYGQYSNLIEAPLY